MPLQMIQGGGGSPYIRFSIEENEWTRSTENGLEPVDMQSAPVLIDITNVQMGWLKLSGGRDWQPWPDNNPMNLERPTDAHNQGFTVKLYSSKLFGDEPVRELCTSQIGLLDFVKQLYDAAEQDENFKTKVPAVQLGDAPKRKIGKGSTRTPEFKIVGWKDRPSDLSPAETASKPAVEKEAAPNSQTSAASDDVSFDLDEI